MKLKPSNVQKMKWKMNSIKDSMNYNYSLAKIHACKDFLNGEDAFGDNYD